MKTAVFLLLIAAGCEPSVMEGQPSTGKVEFVTSFKNSTSTKIVLIVTSNKGQQAWIVVSNTGREIAVSSISINTSTSTAEASK